MTEFFPPLFFIAGFLPVFSFRSTLMNLYFSANSQLSSTFDTLIEQKGINHQIVYAQRDLSPKNTSRITGYRKPKQLWMAKDQTMNIATSSSVMSNDDSGLCSGSSASNETRMPSEHVFTSHQISDLTVLRSSYNGISPSNSSSAPGTFALPSSLTTTSSSPSNHPSPQNRFGGTVTGGSHCESPGALYQPPESSHSKNSKGSSQPKAKRRRGRPPKTKSDDKGSQDYQLSRKRQWSQVPSSLENYPVPQPSSSGSSFFTGGLKIRLRRDVSVDEPICSKKYRSRKSNQKSVQVFRIVESWCDADAPGGLVTRNAAASPVSTNQVPGGFRIGDVVWAKIAGYPHWPSRISALYARTPHQLAQVNPENASSDSLAVSATPADPTLAAGFTAKVEWFAWDQCSYLSCAKLFPFVEYFSKLYSPRTRVKNYAEAITMAKQVVEASSTPSQSISEPQREIERKPSSTDAEHLHLGMSCPSNLHFAFNSLNDSKQPYIICPELPLGLNLPDPTISVGNAPVESGGGNFPFLNLTANPGEFGQVPEQGWEPLPQLDVSGLNDFISGIPTFSDGEEDSSEALASQLKSELGSIGI